MGMRLPCCASRINEWPADEPSYLESGVRPSYVAGSMQTIFAASRCAAEGRTMAWDEIAAEDGASGGGHLGNG
jgi:hypothetical protein